MNDSNSQVGRTVAEALTQQHRDEERLSQRLCVTVIVDCHPILSFNQNNMIANLIPNHTISLNRRREGRRRRRQRRTQRRREQRAQQEAERQRRIQAQRQRDRQIEAQRQRDRQREAQRQRDRQIQVQHNFDRSTHQPRRHNIRPTATQHTESQ